jgi:hypothetical protein
VSGRLARFDAGCPARCSIRSAAAALLCDGRRGAVGLAFASYGAHDARPNMRSRSEKRSRIRLADNNLDGVERRLRPPGSQQANAEELLAELVRLIESSGLTPERLRPPAGTMQRLEMTSLRPSVEAPSGKPGETRVVDVEPRRAPESDNSYSNDPNQTDLATGRRAGASKLKVSALILVSVAAVGSIFWLKRVEPGPPKASPLMETTQGPTTMQPRSNLTVATSSEGGATAEGKVASPEERPIDLNARVSPNNPSQSDLARTVIGASQPDASDGKPVAASVNTSAVAAPIVAPQPVASQSLDPKPAPTVSLPPDSTQIATPTPSTLDSGAAVHSTNAPLPPVRPAPKPAIEAPGVAHQSTSRLDLPTKLSSKSDARVLVAKADATGAKAPAERSEPPRREASVKSEKGANTLNAAQTPTEAQAAPSAQPVPAQQPNPNPVVHAFTNMVGAVAGLIPFVPH